ncbi:MAG: MFS transporter [Candidatus Bathyarchaeia archaeon]
MKSSREEKSRISLTVFYVASFLNDFGSDMIYPIWPKFVVLLPGANMAVLGLLDGLGDAIVSVSQAFSGYVSDRSGKRKLFIWTGYLFGSASRIGYALSTAWQHLIPFRVLDRFGKIRGAPRDAMVADFSTQQNRGKNFGVLRAMDNLGAVCGILASIFLFSMLGYSNLFLVASVPSIISVILILIFIKDKKTATLFKGLSLKDFTPNLRLFLLLSAIFALGAFSYSFLLLYADLLSFRIPFFFEIPEMAVFYLVFTVVASLMSMPFGKLADMVGRKRVLLLSYIFWGALCWGFVYADSLTGLVFLFILFGLHKAAADPVQRTFISELAPTKYRASILGAYQLVVGLFALPASVIAGTLWVSFGMLAPFYFSFILTCVATLLLLFVHERRPQRG